MSGAAPPPTTGTETRPSSSRPLSRDTTDDIESDASSSTRYADISGNHHDGGDAFTPEAEKEVTRLARQLSQTSMKRKTSHDAAAADDSDALKRVTTTGTLDLVKTINPYNEDNIPELDPSHEKFNARLWTKNMLRLNPRIEGLDHTARTAGVMFKDLSVHGYGTPTDFQKDVANVWLTGAGLVRRVFGMEQKTKIQILTDFEGVVKSGEMLVVLGRPGRLVLAKISQRLMGGISGVWGWGCAKMRVILRILTCYDLIVDALRF